MSGRGVLLAVSSLPGKYGVGDFSDEAFEFIRILSKNKVDIWQILPLNPIGYGHSPYQPFSSYAFDEIYISIEDLRKRGLVGRFNKAPLRSRSNYELAAYIKGKAIDEAFNNFKKSKSNMNALKKFLKDNSYVAEYAEFITLKQFNNNTSWNDWTVSKENRPTDYEPTMLKHAFAQMIMFEEWAKIRKYAIKHNIKIIGDVPFYVGYDSSDVYFHKESFMLDEKHAPTCIAGVPPDYFSKDGQRWGNPIWNWDYLYKNEFKAMMDRLYYASKLYDIVRIDHFRAFDSYWAINPTCPTAVDGEWRFPDGHLFFKTLFKKYPDINIIVEDLGDLRPEVLILRDNFNLAGMREIQFTIFDDEILGKHIERENQIYYTSTHDNETLSEWSNKLTMEQKVQLHTRMNELGIQGKTLAEKLIRYSFRRTERLVIASLTDLLGLDKTHRMNIPGEINEVNWTFKLRDFKKANKALKKYFL